MPALSWQEWLTKTDFEAELTSMELVAACNHSIADWFFGVALGESVCSGSDLLHGANRDVVRCGSLQNFVLMCEREQRRLEAGLVARFYGMQTCAPLTEREQQVIESIYAVTPRCQRCREKVPELCDVVACTVFCNGCADAQP